MRVRVSGREGGRRKEGRSGAALKTKNPHANVGKKTNRAEMLTGTRERHDSDKQQMFCRFALDVSTFLLGELIS